MKIDITGKNPYDAVIEFVNKLIEERNACCSDCIVTLWTSNLGESNELLLTGDNGYGDWEWNNDWYEGGEVEVLAVVPVIDLNIKKIPENLLNQCNVYNDAASNIL